MGRRLDCFCKGIQLYITFTQSHRPEEAILDSYDKYVSGFIDIGNYHLIFQILYVSSFFDVKILCGSIVCDCSRTQTKVAI